MIHAKQGPLAKSYHRQTTRRQWYLTEGLSSAKLTIPSIMATSQDATEIAEQESPTNLPKPWQSLGAKGVRNLSSKLGLTLFPPQGNFMRYQLHPQFQAALQEEEREAERSVLEQLLATREQTIMDDVEQHDIRSKVDQALRHLIVVGNVLIYLPPSGGLRIFPLNNYVVRRDFVGKVVEIIYVEPLDKATLPNAIRDALIEGGHEEDPDHPGELLLSDAKRDLGIMVYTRFRLRGKRYFITQEADGVDIPDKSGSVPADKMSLLALRFVSIDGEDYGRGYVEEFRGDLRSYEQLRQSIVIAAVNAAKLTPLVAPGAAITPKKLMEAENGQALFGRPDDVTMLQQNKHADMQVAHLTSNELAQSLSASFLLNSAFQRDAERVTAEEIRRMAEELEDSLGGVYSALAQDLQLPVAMLTEDRLIRTGALEELEPKGAVKPVIVTGLAAIGRGHEFNRLREYVAWLMSEVMPLVPEIGNMLIARELTTRGGIGIGVSTQGLIKTEEQLAQEAQQAQQQQVQETMLAGAAPHLGKTAADEIGMNAGITGGGQASAAGAPTNQ